MKISFIDPKTPDSGVLVLGISSKALDPFQSQVDATTGGQISRIVNDNDFSLEKGTIVHVPHPQGLNVPELILVAMNPGQEKTAFNWESLGGKIWSAFRKTQQKTASIYLPNLSGSLKNCEAYIANGLYLKSWSFDKYHTKKKPTDFCAVKTIEIMLSEHKGIETVFNDLKAVSKGVFLTRELVSEPPNVLYPETLAEQAKELEKMGIKVEVFGQKELTKMGLNALLGVAQGSTKEPQLVVMQWHGGEKNEAPVAFVGKGVTFDSGGISIKPSLDMDHMKWDMAGSGAVIGLMKALAGRKAKANVIGVVGLVENMPDGNAQRPGDIVKSLSGQTIEVLNTDAEGRLVLADALWYTNERFKPQLMVNIATLTGAIVVSLGTHYAGLFSNDDGLAANLLEAGEATGEKLWRFPLADAYDKEIDSVVADMRNIGSGNGGGSITAAQFLQRYVGKTKWAHLDIAGTAWNKKDKPLSQAGATAIGVRLFNAFVQKNFG